MTPITPSTPSAAVAAPDDPALLPPVVQASGLEEQNVIPVWDRDQPAQALINWYSIDGEPSLEAGDVVTVLWGPVGRSLWRAIVYTVTTDDQDAMNILELTIPAALISATDGTEAVAAYQISRTGTDGSTTTRQSPQQIVAV